MKLKFNDTDNILFVNGSEFYANKSFKSYNGRLYCPFQVTNVTYGNASALSTGVAIAVPFIVRNRLSVRTISVVVNTAGSIGSKFFFALIKDNGTGGLGKVMYKSVDYDTTANTKTVTQLNVELLPGIYYAFFTTSSTSNLVLKGIPLTAVENIMGVLIASGTEGISRLNGNYVYNYNLVDNLSGINPSAGAGFIPPLIFFLSDYVQDR